MDKKTNEFGIFCRLLRIKRNLNETEAAKQAGVSQPTISGWEQENGVAPDYQNLVDYFYSYDLKWPESRDFFLSALKAFNGKTAFQINDGIIPKNMIIELLASYLAADGVDPIQKIDVTLECLNKIRTRLETMKEGLKNRGYVSTEDPWVSPLPPPSKKLPKK